MAQQPLSTVENNFTKGLVTEFTGLNFPENAAVDTDNCTYTLVGDVTRRLGVDYEPNQASRTQDRTGCAIAPLYKWNNAGGDGTVEIVVEQVGGIISFYRSSTATVAFPLSAQDLLINFNLASFVADGGAFEPTKEAQFSDGNGYLFVYHPSCDPIYCTYNAGLITGNRITVQLRDFTGVVDGLPVNTRPSTLSNEHLYNLANQGWTQGSPWGATSTNNYSPETTFTTGSKAFTVAAGITGVTIGDSVSGYALYSVAFPGHNDMYQYFIGNVTAYVGTTMTINVVSISHSGGYNPGFAGVYTQFGNWTITPTNHGYIDTWNTDVGGYPSNADVWWYFKNSSDTFDPATTVGNVTLNTGSAPKGHYILNAFNQQRDIVSAVSGITDITTISRPKTGTWFQGRIWYAGTDGAQVATGNANAYTWSSSIYFSQVINDVAQFGNCYQTNDPTSETLFDLLPTDGGVIQIQECAGVYKLFPIQNGMLVFAVNGIWFITGSQGIGFSANDYTITKLSSIQCISGSSFVNVQGLPYFWNDEGIYTVQPAQGGGLSVLPITYDTIWTFYNEIPTVEKKFARGTYDPLNYTIQWVYKDTIATSTADRYAFNKILNFNTKNKAFYPYTIDISDSELPVINGVLFVTSPNGSASLGHVFYACSRFTGSTYGFTFAREYQETYTDWADSGGPAYESYFITGYKVHGQGQRRFQVPYIYVFSRTDGGSVSYKIQGIWDYAISGDSGRWSTAQIVNINEPNFGMVFRRHKIRGQGLVLQFKIKSVEGEPFDVMGWSTYETANAGV